MSADLQLSPIAASHEARGAKMAPFAGWSMPLRFAGTLQEHRAVREDVGIFDVSHLGTVWIGGASAGEVVAATFTNDPGRLVDGGSQYTLCCDEDGGIVDDLIVYRLAGDRWLAIPNAANTAAVLAALAASRADLGRDREVVLDDASTAWATLAIQGPRALELTDRLLVGLGAGTGASDVEHLGVREVELQGHPLLVCRTGYTGEEGCELLLGADIAATIWDSALEAGAVPCGLGARDTLRLEMGYPLHGNELTLETTPYEARLGWAVKLDRDDFRGRAALEAAKHAGPTRRLLGLRSDGRRPLRDALAVGSSDGHALGTTTSGGISPTLGVGIALAYLERGVEPGDRVEVDLRGTAVPCEVIRPPFVDRRPGG